MSGGGSKPRITIDKIITAIRSHGPMTAQQLADRLQCSPCSMIVHLRNARRNGLVALTGRHERKQFIFGAVQTADWPVQP